MCGIAGLVNPADPPNTQLLERLARSLVKRGPDDVGYYCGPPLGLVHRRLSVIDLDGGRQPLFNEDRTLALVFNGEIYDYRQLRDQLQRGGHQFATATDSEVILHLYEDHGPDCLSHLNGMFAFAICHLPTGEIFLARDRLGQKPLFYAAAAPCFAFASGPASLRCLDWVDTTIDASAVHDYLEYQYVPGPRTMHRGIRKLPAGHWARWQNGTLELTRYWAPQITADYRGSYDDARSELREKLRAAVQRRLIADVPLGLFLSGGMDSSIVCALAQAFGEARTFSIGFPEAKFDERQYSQLVAARLGTRHHFLEVMPDDFSHLRRIVGDFEEPFADASMLPTSLLSRFTREHVTVALSGDGADELFGGYYRYRVMALSRIFDAVPRGLRRPLSRWLQQCLPPRTEERTTAGRLRRLLEIAEEDGLARYLRLISRCPAALKQRLYGERMNSARLTDSVQFLLAHGAQQPSGDYLDRIMATDLNTYLTDDILVKVDRASMAYGLEVRSPFLDVEVVALALRLPSSWKQRGTARKRILADACRDLLPPAIFQRPKLGFGVPIARWLRGSWREPARELLLDGRLVADGYFKGDQLAWLLGQHLDSRADHSYTIFALIVLELWLQQG